MLMLLAQNYSCKINSLEAEIKILKNHPKAWTNTNWLRQVTIPASSALCERTLMSKQCVVIYKIWCLINVLVILCTHNRKDFDQEYSVKKSSRWFNHNK